MSMTDAAPPALLSETQPFWDAAEQGRLLIKRCEDTGKLFFYPRDHSPFTLAATTWVEVSGMGTIYSCSVARRAKPPYCIAYVTLDEGPIVMSNIVDADLDQVRIGDRVKVVFKAAPDGKTVPMFAPAS